MVRVSGGGVTPRHGSGKVSPFCPGAAASGGGTRQGPGSSSRDVAPLGLCPPLLGKRGLPGTGRWGSHTPSPGPQPLTADALPHVPARGTATMCAARGSARRRPARASRPSALPRCHTGSKWGFIASCFATAEGPCPWRGSGRSCPPWQEGRLQFCRLPALATDR